jgi:hypothetical protein
LAPEGFDYAERDKRSPSSPIFSSHPKRPIETTLRAVMTTRHLAIGRNGADR